MDRQTTLLTSHKGVDLHAATALRVMQDRLEGGDRLRALFRCEMHTFGSAAADLSLDRLLDQGRYFNPNKHHYGHFESEGMSGGVLGGVADGGELLPGKWPGTAAGSDLAVDPQELYDVLLGGTVPADCSAVDVAALPRGQEGPLFSGVLWRLVLAAGPAEALELGTTLAVARSRKQGLLVNPHMESWSTAVRRERT